MSPSCKCVGKDDVVVSEPPSSALFMFILPEGEFFSEKACEMSNSPWKVHRSSGGGTRVWQESRSGSIHTGAEERVLGVYRWRLQLEIWGNIFSQENLHMAHVDAFGRLPELLRGFTVSVWSAHTAKKRPK